VPKVGIEPTRPVRGPRKHVSARIPADAALTLEMFASMRGMSRSEYIADILVTRAERDLLENADWLRDELPKELARREEAS
jgi:hypothetical protein